MAKHLKVSVGQYTDKGRKEINQDFHGVYIPKDPALSSKGIAIALADGISSSDVGQVASEATVKSFLEDYYCTSDAWSVKKSAQCVLAATNSWLYSQSQQGQYRYDKDKGYVCTLSALVIKSTTAHIFHLGDTRIYRLSHKTLEQLTNDHRLWVSGDKSYLSRAMGINERLEIDYKAVPIDKGDIFILTTDGVYEFTSSNVIIDMINQHQDCLGLAAEKIVHDAFEKGSDDNLSIQIIKIDELPSLDANDIYHQLTSLPFPPILEARAEFDGYKIIRELQATSRSHVYLAFDIETEIQVVIKTPSVELQGNPAYLERFLTEEWIARRINSAHVMKPCVQVRKRHFLYIASEFIEGQTLTQWMIDHPKPELDVVRNIVEQIAKGLHAFHRLEMLHQDLRPENILIDTSGTVKIIDFGSTQVAGIAEISSPIEQENILGTVQYTAPEYFLGESGSSRSDIFSLGVITYQMLTGELPYGVHAAKARTKASQRRLKYKPFVDDERKLPRWVNNVLKKAVHPDPVKRHEVLSEFTFELRHPSKTLSSDAHTPILESNPADFWRSVSIILLIIIGILIFRLSELKSVNTGQLATYSSGINKVPSDTITAPPPNSSPPNFSE